MLSGARGHPIVPCLVCRSHQLVVSELDGVHPSPSPSSSPSPSQTPLLPAYRRLVHVHAMCRASPWSPYCGLTVRHPSFQMLHFRQWLGRRRVVRAGQTAAVLPRHEVVRRRQPQQSLSARQEIRTGLARANIKLRAPPGGTWASHMHGPLIAPGVACSSSLPPALSQRQKRDHHNDKKPSSSLLSYTISILHSPFSRAPVPRPRPVLNCCETARTSNYSYSTVLCQLGYQRYKGSLP